MTRRRIAVRLFAGDVLIATRWTERTRPEHYYAVGPRIYDVVTYRPVADTDGREGFDVTLEERR